MLHFSSVIVISVWPHTNVLCDDVAENVLAIMRSGAIVFETHQRGRHSNGVRRVFEGERVATVCLIVMVRLM